MPQDTFEQDFTKFGRSKIEKGFVGTVVAHYSRLQK